MNIRFVLFLFLLAPGAFFGFNSHVQADDFIVGGVTVAADDPIAATTVSVLTQTSAGIALCSGSILSSDIVVTAGHCVYDEKSNTVLDASQLRVLFGRSIKKSVQESEVINVAVPLSYRGPQSEKGEDVSDIALIHFSGGLPNGYQAAVLLTDPSALQKGGSVILAGYGITDAQTHKGSGILRKVTVTIDNPHLGHTEVVFDQTDGHGACHGDSGGPAFVQQGGAYALFGVTSRGYPDGGPDDCMQQSVYTSILAWTDWINHTIPQLESSKDNGQSSGGFGF